MQIAPVVGTAMYMSPEQARGLRIDHRSDIFSFGTVLFEMLAGFPPFRRGTTAETLSAIVNDDPPELSAPRPVNSALERVVRHCLEKEPGARFQNARDLAFGLENLPASGTTQATPPAVASRGGQSRLSAAVCSASPSSRCSGISRNASSPPRTPRPFTASAA